MRLVIYKAVAETSATSTSGKNEELDLTTITQLRGVESPSWICALHLSSYKPRVALSYTLESIFHIISRTSSCLPSSSNYLSIHHGVNARPPKGQKQGPRARPDIRRTAAPRSCRPPGTRVASADATLCGPRRAARVPGAQEKRLRRLCTAQPAEHEQLDAVCTVGT